MDIEQARATALRALDNFTHHEHEHEPSYWVGSLHAALQIVARDLEGTPALDPDICVRVSKRQTAPVPDVTPRWNQSYDSALFDALKAGE